MQDCKIEVTYDGRYPNTCSGTLSIKVDDKVIYSQKHRCRSTGSCYFTNGYSEEHVERGELYWEDADNFDEEIRDLVELELSKYNVCCGGCL